MISYIMELEDPAYRKRQEARRWISPIPTLSYDLSPTVSGSDVGVGWKT